MMISACSESVKNIANLNDDSISGFASIQKQIQGDSLLPYFEFDTNGNKIEFDFKNEAVLMKNDNQRKILVVNSEEDFINLENTEAINIETDNEYRKSIARPLDYACRTSLLALSQKYSVILTNAGDTLLSDQILFEGCVNVGFSCENNCDESSEDDPYLAASKVLKKTVENRDYASEATVEIYPYKMIASSFINGINFIYSSAGAETYFKKRERVWRGLSGMVWRWVDFDPDRNGVRVGCFQCDYKIDEYGGPATEFACERETESSVDTWGDSEDITQRCYLDMFVKSVRVGITEEGNTKPNASFRFIKKYEGGVIGMHRVVHKDLEFKAKTSKGLSKSVIDFINSNKIYRVDYR